MGVASSVKAVISARGGLCSLKFVQGLARKPLYGNYNMSSIPHRVSVVSLHRVCVVAAACLAVFLGAPSSNALVLDWNYATWSNTLMDQQSGVVANSYDLSGDTVNDITVALVPKSNVWTTDQPSGAGNMTPAITNTMTGGFGSSNQSLTLAADLHTNSRLTVQISFTGTQPGAANVSFTIFDIDLTADRDLISNIYGIALDGTQVPATITSLGSIVNLAGTGLTQTLTSYVPAPNDSSLGNATISFGPTVITDVFFTFGNSSGPPRYQNIAIGDISFTPVPEINPAATSAMSCLLAAGLTVFMQRRAKMKARRLQAAKS